MNKLLLFLGVIVSLVSQAKPKQLEIYYEDTAFVNLKSRDEVAIQLRAVPHMQVVSREHAKIPPGMPAYWGVNTKLYSGITQISLSGGPLKETDKVEARIMTYREFLHPTLPATRRWERTLILELKCQRAGRDGRSTNCYGDTYDHLDSYHYDFSAYISEPSRMKFAQAISVRVNDRWLEDPVNGTHDFNFDLKFKATFADFFRELFKTTLD